MLEYEWEFYNTKIDNIGIDRLINGFGVPESKELVSRIARVILPTKQVGIATSTTASKEELLKRAVKVAKHMPPSPFATELSPFDKAKVRKKELDHVDIDYLFNAIDKIDSIVDNRAPIVEIGASKSDYHFIYENSNGVLKEANFDKISLSVVVGEKETTGYNSTSVFSEPKNMEEFVDFAIKTYKLKSKRAKPVGKEVPVIFSHEALYVVLKPILFSLKGDKVVENRSNYIGKIGEKVLDSKMTLVDNPFGENTFAPFDAEGYNTKRVELVDKGVLKTYILDSFTSKKLSMSNTFNSSSITLKPSTEFHNIEIRGNKKIESVISSIKEGYIVYDLYPAHTVNLITGDFGLNSSTLFYIKDGSIVGHVPKGVVTANSFSIFNSVQAITDDNRPDLGSYDLPSILTSAKVV